MKDYQNSKNKNSNFKFIKDNFQEKEDFQYEKNKMNNKKQSNYQTFNNKNKSKSNKMKEDQLANLKTKNYEEELELIKSRIAKETPPCGFYYFNKADFNFSESDSEKENEEEIQNTNSTLNKIQDGELNEIKDKNREEPSIKEKNLWKKEKLYFKDLPISRKTLKGLLESKFIKMTPVQRYTLPHSLAGRDILGASKTGSGKTLSFIIPVLECLYKQKWTSLDGLGALLILPTRELAMQVFEVFRLVGKYHDFSIGLVIGGNSLEEEKSSLYKINILIGTPGRLSQHFTETVNFNTDNVQILCIDEADRILDEGFEEALNEIISYLPSKKRQTLLFSATLSRDLKRMAKVSLKSPEYINVSNTDAFLSIAKTETNEQKIDGNNKSTMQMDKINLQLNSNNDSTLNKNNKKIDGKDNNLENYSNSKKFSDVANASITNTNDLTPINLNQFYTLCETHQKLDILFSFLKTHKNSKCLIFLSSCKQVRYYTEIFRRLKLGMTFLDLHGKQKQGKRTNIFYTFLNKKNSVLFATDIASRGVDFPAVDWVIQLDCPEDIATYIHRVGRTARYKSKGNSLLMVNKKEEKLVEILQSKNVNIKKIKINNSKVVGLQPILRSLISENPDLIHLAQKAIKSYLKSIYLQSKKEIFDLKAIDVQQLALSYGLVNLPEIKISKKSENDLKNLKKKVMNEQDSDDSSDLEIEDDELANHINSGLNQNKKKSKLQKLKEKIAEKRQQKAVEINKKMMEGENINNLSAIGNEISNEEKKNADGFLKLKRKNDKSLYDENEGIARKVNVQEDEKNIENMNHSLKKNDYYEKLKAKLTLNQDEDKIKEKARIHDKHKADRLRSKQFDYEKHGINEEESENDISGEDTNDNVNKSYLEDLPLKEGKKKAENMNMNIKKIKKDEYIDSDGEIYNFKFSEDKILKKKEKSILNLKKGNVKMKFFFFMI